MKIRIISNNSNISLNDELKNHFSKKFYRNIKSKKIIIYVNKEPTLGYKLINEGDVIEFEIKKETNDNWPVVPIFPNVVFENTNYLVINKPENILSIPTKGNPKSIFQEILYYLDTTNQEKSVSILNRLDYETKGLMVIAKNRLAAHALQPTHKHMIRKYKCLVHGKVKNKSDQIRTLISKNSENNKRYVSQDCGKEAISHFKVLWENDNYSLLEFVLETGRTHQIRVHCSYLGTPICGDKVYGIDDDFDNLCLCSYYVEFKDCFLKQEINLEIECGWETNEKY